MIGLFLRNQHQEICFVQVSKDIDIASFHYTAHARVMTATMVDDTEEMIIAEIAPEIHEAIRPQQLLVVQLDDAGNFQREYHAALSVG